MYWNIYIRILHLDNIPNNKVETFFGRYGRREFGKASISSAFERIREFDAQAQGDMLEACQTPYRWSASSRNLATFQKMVTRLKMAKKFYNSRINMNIFKYFKLVLANKLELKI